MGDSGLANDLTGLETHFRFGQNWRDFAATIDGARIEAAVADLGILCSPEMLAGARVLDIGCGSGLPALAALRGGCAAIRCIDLDPESVATTSAVLTRFAPEADWAVAECSVFDLGPGLDGPFDIVHAWGVLHHTGCMWAALASAADLVGLGGHLVVALYAKTPACGFWRIEKRLYTAAPGWAQAVVRTLFKATFLAGIVATGRSPAAYVRDYFAKRGMSWSHDVHDWLGGYPYESATPTEVRDFLAARGFVQIRENLRLAPAFGLFGTPCNEYVYRRGSQNSKPPQKARVLII